MRRVSGWVLGGLAWAVCGWAAAQPAPAPAKPEAAPLSDTERAKRDANKVFSFIKLQAARPAPALRTLEPVRVAQAPDAPSPAAEMDDPAALIAAQPTASGTPALGVDAVAALAVVVSPPVASAPPLPEPLEALTLLHHVAPTLTGALRDTQRNASVQVQFTVLPDGTPAKVAAKPGAPARLALAAVRAVEQWRFAPIRVPRDAAVEVAFQLD
jgi:protein TonB